MVSYGNSFLTFSVFEGLFAIIRTFPTVILRALAATLAARLDFDVFSAIFWRFYLF